VRSRRWESRLEPLNAGLPELPAGDELWSRIAQRSFGAAPTDTSRCRALCVPQPPAPASGGDAGWRPIPAAALSFGIMLGLGTPLLLQLTQGERHGTQLPESYVGVLATAAGKPG